MQPTNTYATRKNFKAKFVNTFLYMLEDNITEKSAVTYVVLVLLLFQIGKYSTNSYTNTDLSKHPFSKQKCTQRTSKQFVNIKKSFSL